MRKKRNDSISKELGAFKITISKTRAVIESVSKDWMVVFSYKTKPFFFIAKLFEGKHWNTLEEIARCSFICCTYTVTESSFNFGVYPLIEECAKIAAERASQMKNDETDEEILKQEKLKQEYKDGLKTNK